MPSSLTYKLGTKKCNDRKHQRGLQSYLPIPEVTGKLKEDIPHERQETKVMRIRSNSYKGERCDDTEEKLPWKISCSAE